MYNPIVLCLLYCSHSTSFLTSKHCLCQANRTRFISFVQCPSTDINHRMQVLRRHCDLHQLLSIQLRLQFLLLFSDCRCFGFFGKYSDQNLLLPLSTSLSNRASWYGEIKTTSIQSATRRLLSVCPCSVTSASTEFLAQLIMTFRSRLRDLATMCIPALHLL